MNDHAAIGIGGAGPIVHALARRVGVPVLILPLRGRGADDGRARGIVLLYRDRRSGVRLAVRVGLLLLGRRVEIPGFIFGVREPLDEIATVVRGLTYGEMIEFAGALWKAQPEGSAITQENLSNLLHRWSLIRSAGKAPSVSGK